MKTLKQIRTFRGFSQRRLAEAMEMQQPHIVTMEKGDSLSPGTQIATIFKINKALNCRSVIHGSKIYFEEIT